MAVAAVAGTFAFIITNYGADQTVAQSLTLSVLIGSVIMLVQLLIDFDGRIERIERWMHATDLAIESAKWQQALGDSALDREAFTRFREAVVNFGQDCPPLIRRFTEIVVKGDTELIDRLSRGDREMTCDGEDHDWILQLTQATMKTIDATSTTTVDGEEESFTGGFWTSEHGRRYLKAQAEARTRGVTIRRLFIMPGDPDDNDEVFRSIAQEQRGAGIEVRVLRYDQIPALHDAPTDFILFDEEVAYEAVPASNRQLGFFMTRLRTRTDYTRACKERFELLWQLAAEAP
ncbi:DUF6879 family protein [Actinomadura bangladeshensis]|uniref:DUF6879 domain-containing protein n=1 Tax=Actinomadura bangladeshensis TaxID=453573 RepID=A0A4R4P6U0_9ACTN|nr:DUF6879 family protein [Actinomadura bangladeshensis]TDC18218.1 hypothetical protein E1284_07065 [Actinomadura bangladeshensis]